MSERVNVTEFAFPGPLRDQLVGAVLRGEKTSTSGLLAEYEHDGEELPGVRERSHVVDSGGEPVADWRDAHKRFWDSYIPAHIGDREWKLTDDTLNVAERFRLVELLDG